MKPKSTLHAFLLACGSLLAISCLHAAPLTWDPGATGGSDGSGDWDSGTNWWDGASAAAWTSGDDATIGSGGGTTGGSGDTITLGAATAANSVTFEAFNFQYTLNGATLSTNSINTNTGSGQAYFNTMSIDAGASPLVIGGTAAPNPDRTIANVKMKASVTGTAGLTKNGPGVLWWETNPAYTGTTTINGGVYRTQNDPNTALPSGNIILNGGQVGGYWNQNLTNRTLGTDFSIPGGESGFTQHGGASLTVELSSDAVLQWGDADFNPSVLDMMSIQSNNSARVLMKNPIDLNGAQRTIRVNQGNYTGVRAEFEDEFSNSDGVNPAGITKTGPGLLHLNAPDGGGGSDYDSLIVNGGFVKFGSSWNNTWSGENLPGTANVEIQDGVLGGYFSLDVNLGTGPGEWQITGGTSGINMLQSDRVDITFNSGAEIVWGSASFAPDVLVLNAENPQALPSSVARLNNPLDLNGADRTVFTDSTAAAPVNAPNDGAFGQIIGRGGVLNGDIRNTGATAGLIKTGAGTIALGGTNTYDGGTTISEGGLYFPKIAAMPANGVVTVNDGTTLLVGLGGAGEWTTGTSGNGTLGGLLAGLGGTAPSTLSFVGNSNLGLVVSGSQTYSGVVSSAGNVATYGSGTLELDQNNTFTGNLIVDGGSSLSLSGDNSGASGNVNINNGYLLAGTANLPAGAISFASTGNSPAVWVASGSIAPDLGSANDVFFSGDGGFAATDSALTVSLNANAEIDWSAGTGFNGKKLQLGSPVSTASVELTNGIDLDSNRNIYLFDNSASNDDVSILSGNIERDGSNNRNLTIEGAGTLVLSGTNNFGTGTLTIGSSGGSSVVRALEGTGLPTAAKLYFNNGVLESNGTFTRNIGTGSGEVYWNNKGGFAANGGALTVTLEGGIALNWGDTNAGFRGQNPLYLNSPTADNVVTFQNGIILENNRNINVPDNPDTDADYAVIAGVISQSGNRNLTKDGDGKLVFSGANSYTGTTTVNGGTLIINGSTSTGLIDVKANGKFLGGTGTIGGNVTLENNAGLTFGLSTGPGSHDKLDVTGSLTFESASVLTITSSGGATTGTYTLVTASSPPTGSVPATVNLPAGWTADAPFIDGNDLKINVTSTGAASNPYDDWAATYSPADLSNKAGDNDGDDLTNLQEFAFGTNPTSFTSGSITYVANGEVTSAGLPVAANLVSPGVDYRAIFGRRKDYVTAGLIYTVQFSAGLDVWVNSTDTPTVLTSSTGDIDAVSVPYPLFINTVNGVEKPTFFRVGVTETIP